MKKSTFLSSSLAFCKNHAPVLNLQKPLNLVVICCLMFVAGNTFAAIRYVKAGGTGNGSTWSAASGDFQAMINASAAGDQVWVAAGTYKPTTGTDRNISFVMKEGIAIYGGFQGSETLLSSRPAITYSKPSLSILSGYINGDRSNHIIFNNGNRLTSAAVLDGFTISGGKAVFNGDFRSFGGAGVCNYNSSPTIRYCFFTANIGDQGGAILNHTSNATFINCRFSDNSVLLAGGKGGAIYNLYGGISFFNCIFSNNTANKGGAMYCNESNPVITNCDFVNNPNGAIGMQTGNAVLTNCIIWNNSSYPLLEDGGNFTLSYCNIDVVGFAGTNGNINLDPLFIDAGNGNFHLKPNSPVINKGNNAANSTATDLDGNPRKYGVIDMGAYENECDPVVITSQLQNISACTGSTATFTIGVTGVNDAHTTFNYQWLKNGHPFALTNYPQIVLINVQASDIGSYQVEIITSCGTVTSSAATLTMDSPLGGFYINPRNAEKCAGEPVSFAIDSIANVTYQWTKNGANIDGATGTSYTINAIKPEDQGAYVVHANNSCGSAPSDGTYLTVNTPPSISTLPASTTKCVGEPVSFSVSATGTNLTYQWKKDGTNITGATDATYSIVSASAASAGNYNVVVSGTCGSPVTSNGAYLFVNAAPAITAQPVNVTTCVGVPYTISVSATGPRLNYEWQISTDAAASWESVSSSNASSITFYTVYANFSGRLFRVLVSNSCGTTISDEITLTVNSPSAPVVTVTDKCGSSILSTTATGSLLWSTGATTPSITVSDAATYTVTETVNGCTSPAGSAVAAPKTAPAAPVITVANNCGNSTLSTTATGDLLWSTGAATPSITVNTGGSYTVTQTVNGCTSIAGSAVAAPKTAPAAPVVTVANNCGNSTLSTTATGSLLWSTGETTPSITVSNPGTYTVTKTVNGCASAAGSGTAAPKTAPSAPIVTVTNNCGNSTLSTTATGNLLWSTGAATPSITVNTGGSYTVTQTVNGCTSTAGSAVAAPKTAPSKPVITVTGATAFCTGGSVVLSAPDGFTYKWSNNAVTQTITVNQSGSYSVAVTNAAGCSSPASDAITVTVGNDTQKPVITCPAAVTSCYAAGENYTIAPLQATDNCGVASISYTITGTTTRSGNGANASGKFSSGTSTITWTVKDGSGNTSTCQSNVVINEKFTVAIPDGWALGSGCTLNTVYKGYVPAEYILLVAKPTGGKSPYTYKWSNGATASFILVNPAAATTYSVTIKDAKGCIQSASKQINVVDVRCGSKMDKVTLCYKGATKCTEQKDVADYLLKGAYLGNCKGKTASKAINEIVEQEVTEGNDLAIKAFPNPSTTYFKLALSSSNEKDKISVTIVDEVGRAVERRIVNPGQTLEVGDQYRAGMYFAQAVQGNKRVTVKLIKQAW